MSDLAVLVFLRFTEKGNLEVLLFTIQSKMRANNQKVYMPREGKLISDINKVSLSLCCPPNGKKFQQNKFLGPSPFVPFASVWGSVWFLMNTPLR